MKEVTYYKAVVVPRVGDKFIVVRDTAHQEITFVVGGCKVRESDRHCALRELYEETRGIITETDERALIKAFTFTSRDRSEKELRSDKRLGIHVTMQYTVFYLDVTCKASFWSIRHRFQKSHPLNDTETDDILLMTKKQLSDPNVHMWRFMRERVLPRLVS